MKMFKFISLLIASKKNLIEENKQLKRQLDIWMNADGHPLTEYHRGYMDGVDSVSAGIPILVDIIK